MGDEGKLDYQVPGNKTAKLSLFWASNFFGARDQSVLSTTRKMLDDHGIGMKCAPIGEQKSADRTFDFGPGLITRDQYVDVYSRMSDAAADPTCLLVMFCQFQMTANGLTVIDAPTKCFVRPMVLVAPTPSGGDMVTLLHEIGHASGLNHDLTSTGSTGRNFMNEAESRSTMMKWQLQKLSAAWFVS
jgi:hypothetical protein